jgi:hypothetical protein
MIKLFRLKFKYLLKKNLVFVFLLCFSISTFSQDEKTEYKEYSYSEFFKLIEVEKDTIFKLKNAIIRFKAKTDSAFIIKSPYLEPPLPLIKSKKIIVDKHIVLTNVHFPFKYEGTSNADDSNSLNNITNGVIHNVHFKKSVRLTQVAELQIVNSEFDDKFHISNYILCSNNEQFYRDKKLKFEIDLGNNTFNRGLGLWKSCDQNNIDLNVIIYRNKIHRTLLSKEKKGGQHAVNIQLLNGGFFIFYKNKISGNLPARIENKKLNGSTISENNFSDLWSIINISKQEELTFNKNSFNNALEFRLDNLNATDLVDWNQFKTNFYSGAALDNYVRVIPDDEYQKTFNDSFRSHYRKTIRIQNADIYAGEAALKGILYRHYRDKFDMANANAVYINLKDFETKRLEYLFDTHPSFDSFFQWKVNQFLKVFSNYGTKPSKAITFSVYVVFFFALIYLFFPNSWDRHGKNRIINRYTFFTKYMNQNSGIHEVYLEDKKDDLLEYHEFKTYMKSSGKTVPKFFLVTALPIYKWAISGTKLSAFFLKRIDIMKGTWQELPQHQRVWKSILLVGAFLVAVLYDIFIKMLNALMLSINTFTTLGFGEIPIKGLPRYLAIIQGFIGWFMLTIFSVSLISQLLN